MYQTRKNKQKIHVSNFWYEKWHKSTGSKNIVKVSELMIILLQKKLHINCTSSNLPLIIKVKGAICWTLTDNGVGSSCASSILTNKIISELIKIYCMRECWWLWRKFDAPLRYFNYGNSLNLSFAAVIAAETLGSILSTLKSNTVTKRQIRSSHGPLSKRHMLHRFNLLPRKIKK